MGKGTGSVSRTGGAAEPVLSLQLTPCSILAVSEVNLWRLGLA